MAVTRCLFRRPWCWNMFHCRHQPSFSSCSEPLCCSGRRLFKKEKGRTLSPSPISRGCGGLPSGVFGKCAVLFSSWNTRGRISAGRGPHDATLRRQGRRGAILEGTKPPQQPQCHHLCRGECSFWSCFAVYFLPLTSFSLFAKLSFSCVLTHRYTSVYVRVVVCSRYVRSTVCSTLIVVVVVVVVL